MRTPLSTQQEAVVMFDSYCKTVILNCARRYGSREMRQTTHELLVPDVESLVIAETMERRDTTYTLLYNDVQAEFQSTVVFEAVQRLKSKEKAWWSPPILLWLSISSK